MFLFCYHLRLIKYQAIVRKIKLRNNVVPDLKRVYRGQRYADRFFCQDEVIWNIVLTGHNDHVSKGAFSVFIQVIVLLYSGMHISEFWGLTLSDLDMENRIIRIDHQLQRTSAMEYVIESTQTNAGTRKIPMTELITFNTFWRWRRSHMTLHALFAVRNTETQTGNIRKRKEFLWSKRFSLIQE